MLRELGLSPLTARYRCRDVREFLTRIDEAGLRLDALTIAQVDDLLSRKVRDQGYARVSVQTYASNLRVFFRYAESRGWCRTGLAAAIMTPRVFAYETLPAGLSWDDVNQALTAARGKRPADIRDRALLLLLVVYGLRAGEVVGLRLEDFDWQKEMLTVPHGKSQRPRTYPLCRSVGDAVLRYLREVRPRSTRREVFLMLRAPFSP
jgi:site-specific recombinase XerD